MPSREAPVVRASLAVMLVEGPGIHEGGQSLGFLAFEHPNPVATARSRLHARRGLPLDPRRTVRARPTWAGALVALSADRGAQDPCARRGPVESLPAAIGSRYRGLSRRRTQ